MSTWASVAAQIQTNTAAKCWAYTSFTDCIPRKILSSPKTPFMIIQVTGLFLPPGLFSTGLNITPSLRQLRFSSFCPAPGPFYMSFCGFPKHLHCPYPTMSELSTLCFTCLCTLVPTPPRATLPSVPLGNRGNISSGLMQDYLMIW